MGKLMNLLKGACQHSEYKVTKTPIGLEYSVKAVCRECDNLLYEKHVYDVDCSQTTIIDEVYQLLYTKAGRMSLLIEAMEEAGVTPPECWIKPQLTNLRRVISYEHE